MKKITALAAAAFAAVTLTATSYAQESFQLEPEAPMVVYFDNSDDEYIDAGITAGEPDRMFLENSVQAEPEDDAAAEDSEKSFTAQDILKMAGISLCIGLVIALVVCLIMKSCMKTALPKITANDYIRKNSFNITRSRDIFIYANVTKKKRPQENKDNK